LSSVVLGTALVSLPVTRAHANETVTNVCTSGALIVCSSFTFNNTSGNTWLLVLTVNTVNGASASSTGAFLSAVGMFNSPPATGPFSNTSGPSGWTFATGTTGDCSDLNGASFSGNVYACFAKNGNTGLTSVTFQFDDANASDLSKLNTSSVGYHLQGIPQTGGATCSAKIGVSAIAGANGTSSVSTSDCTGTTTTTPEPASLFLVGTGLAGLGGLGVIRRRRRE